MNIKTIDIIPKVHQNLFMAKLVMSDYDVRHSLYFSITARRDDGLYQTERFSYPDPKFDGTTEVFIPFFEMTKTCVAQIVGVKIYNEEVNTYFSPLLGTGDQKYLARYNDSLTSSDNPVDTSPIDIKFHMYSDGDPKKLIVVDESSWGALRNYPSMIYIKIPGFKDEVSYYLGKNQVNIFNSVTLGLNCVEPGDPLCFFDLPDGVYDITVKSGDFYCNKKYLKTDQIQMDIDKIYSRSCLSCNALSDELIKHINEAEIMLRGAEANTRLGNFESAHMLIDRVATIVDRASECKQCK